MWRRLIALALILGAGVVSLLARGGGGCVAAGTLIDTPAGPRAVETLQAGDAVWSQSAGRIVPATVQAVYEVAPAEFIELSAGGHTLRLTPEHPVQTAAGVFTCADRLTEPAELFAATERVALTQVRHLPADRPAYNLVVSPGGVFFA
ncbi:MAG: Hint domain-containing protein, partial [Lacunisphaera sp.]|nr:Hint domain-containing protein [Lacunisphaera sp.]